MMSFAQSAEATAVKKPDPTGRGLFEPVARCWVCDGAVLSRYCQCRMDFREYAEQDPGLHKYTGEHVWLVRCASCGFGQPETLPTLPRYFDRMYDQQWSPAWVEEEFRATYKDLIFDEENCFRSPQRQFVSTKQ